MRVADTTTNRTYLNHLNKAKNDLSTTSEQIFTGHRFSNISGDVSSGVRVLKIRMEMSTTEVHKKNVQAVSDELVSVEDTMMEVQDMLTTFHELALNAANETNDADARNIIANEVSALKDQMLSLLNTKYNDRFMFGGSNSSTTPPFSVGDDGRLKYQGFPVDEITYDSDQRTYYHVNPETDEKTVVPMDDDVFFDVGLGIKMDGSQTDPDTAFKVSYSGLDFLGFGVDENGDSKNIYNVIFELETAMREDSTAGINKADTALTSLRSDFRGHITDIGAKTSFLEASETRLQRQVDTQQLRISDLMGTNNEEAITTLASNEFTLTAVQRMSSYLLPTSLMDFI